MRDKILQLKTNPVKPNFGPYPLNFIDKYRIIEAMNRGYFFDYNI